MKIRDILDLVKNDLPDGIIDDLQKEITSVDILSSEKEIFNYSVKMIRQTDNSIIYLNLQFIFAYLVLISKYVCRLP